MNEQYQQIVFMQGDEALDALEILEQVGEQAAIDYLRLWESVEDTSEVSPISPAGDLDQVYEGENGYILNCNLRMGYIGLCRKLIN